MADYRDAIQVDGLRPFRDALREAGSKLPHELQKANKATAEFVVQHATSRAQSVSRQTARAAKGLSASAGQLSATVRLDGNRIPGALGSEFGAGHNLPRQTSRGVVRGWNQFPTWRGNGDDAGIFLYPTIRSSDTEISAFYDRVIADVMAQAFPE